jgi:hypothetical protein
MLKKDTKVRIQLPEYVKIATSITGLVEKTVKNESPYNGREASIVSEDYETTEKFNQEETWYFVQFKDNSFMPPCIRNTVVSFPESSLVPI